MTARQYDNPRRYTGHWVYTVQSPRLLDPWQLLALRTNGTLRQDLTITGNYTVSKIKILPGKIWQSPAITYCADRSSCRKYDGAWIKPRGVVPLCRTFWVPGAVRPYWSFDELCWNWAPLRQPFKTILCENAIERKPYAETLKSSNLSNKNHLQPSPISWDHDNVMIFSYWFGGLD